VVFIQAFSVQSRAAQVVAVADYTNYNAGEVVRIRLQPAAKARATIRYGGQRAPVVSGIPIDGSDYTTVWKIPDNAETGRYNLDLTLDSGSTETNATSFAVHRQFAKVASVELDKTFYTSGDSVNPVITVRNLSDRPLDHLQVEFEPYTYPWIVPSPDEPRMWKYVVDKSLSLGPGAAREFRVQKAAVVQADHGPVAIYYSVVIRDSRNPDRIYDLAFAPPAFTFPPNTPVPKQYPFLYLYRHLADVVKSQTYQQFYPPEFVSDVIHFETSHTMYPTGVAPTIKFSVTPHDTPEGSYLRVRVLDAAGRQLEDQKLTGEIPGAHTTSIREREPGRYLIQSSLENASGVVLARNELELAANKLPKSILIFCAHEDDDTAHPGIIRAAVENNIPIHFVYLTSGDGGGCDRFYMHSCDAARAMDFGEVRMDEARASLGHLGVARENLFFLGLPDGGLGQIWNDYLTADHPYLSVLLASEHSPYREAAIPNLAYAREPVVEAAKEFIRRFSPDLIITGHPDERHVDHRTNNWIVVKAMQELLREGLLSRDTELLVDQVYGPQPGKHAPFHYEKQTLFVSGEAAKLGQEATWYYESQDGNHLQANIVDFAKLPRTEAYPHFRILDWQDHEGWNERSQY
jgi:LmbE family N-acetylglucosaminyl deacetylase